MIIPFDCFVGISFVVLAYWNLSPKLYLKSISPSATLVSLPLSSISINDKVASLGSGTPYLSTKKDDSS